MTPPEFSRPVRMDTIGEAPRHIRIDANADERRRLAGRFRLVEIGAFASEIDITRVADGVVAEGRIIADVVQSCVATGEPVPAHVDAPFRLRFVPDLGDREEIDLGEEDFDIAPIENGEIDLGEAAAETLSLELDPFPRAPNADEVLRAAGVKSEDEASGGAFDALQALKDKMGE